MEVIIVHVVIGDGAFRPGFGFVFSDDRRAIVYIIWRIRDHYICDSSVHEFCDVLRNGAIAAQQSVLAEKPQIAVLGLGLGYLGGG